MLQNFNSRPWTPEEDKKVLQGMARVSDEATACRNLANMLGRSPGAVKMRYRRLCKKMGMTGQAAGLAGKMNRVFEKLMAAAQQSETGRLTAADLEKIAKEEHMKYARVMSLWGQVNAHGFWVVKEMRILRDQIAIIQQKVQQLEQEKEQLETVVRQKEEALASIRKTLSDIRELITV